MCEFESSEVSHPLLRLATACNLRLTGPEIPGFAHSTLSPDSRSLNLGGEIAKSLRPSPQKFPFCRDFRRRPVRTLLPPIVAVGLADFSYPQSSELGVFRVRLPPDQHSPAPPTDKLAPSRTCSSNWCGDGVWDPLRVQTPRTQLAAAGKPATLRSRFVD
jgi:hypothetical protein